MKPGVINKESIRYGLIILALSLCVLFSGCLFEGGDDGAVKLRFVERHNALKEDTVRVGSLNMAIGFSLEPVLALIFSNEDSVIVPQFKGLYQEYVHALPQERVRAMADAIVQHDLDIVGLQEVLSMTEKGVLHCDFVASLMAELTALTGLNYHIHMHKMNDYTIGPYYHNQDTVDLRFSEGNALLIKPGFMFLDTFSVVYDSILPIPAMAQPMTSERGFNYAKIQSPAGGKYQLFNTHIELDFFKPGLASYQVQQLFQTVDSLESGNISQIILGDFNLDQENATYLEISNKGWVDTHGYLGNPAKATCCLSDFRDPNATWGNQRIDYIFAGNITGILAVDVTLDEWIITAAGDAVFAADHKLVIAELEAQY